MATELLSPELASRLIGITRRGVDKAIRRGKLIPDFVVPAPNPGKQTVAIFLFLPETIDAFVQARGKQS